MFPYVCAQRLDEAAVALQKEKNMYKEIENFAMCFKVSFFLSKKKKWRHVFGGQIKGQGPI